jgi:transcription elongation factor
MGRRVSAAARRELVLAVAERYRGGRRSEKVRILDEFVRRHRLPPEARDSAADGANASRTATGIRAAGAGTDHLRRASPGRAGRPLGSF